jgi:hypothetical protein
MQTSCIKDDQTDSTVLVTQLHQLGSRRIGQILGVGRKQLGEHDGLNEGCNRTMASNHPEVLQMCILNGNIDPASVGQAYQSAVNRILVKTILRYIVFW